MSASTSDDLMTALGMLSIQQRHEARMAADEQGLAASKAQQAAQAEKIAKMRELADDTFTAGLVEGTLDMAGAAASGASASLQFKGSMDKLPGTKDTARSLELARNAGFLEAGSKACAATSRLGGGIAKSDQETDRADIAVADAAIDRAKSAGEAASRERGRADDDIRETLNNIRQYLAAKSQLANAAIIKG